MRWFLTIVLFFVASDLVSADNAKIEIITQKPQQGSMIIGRLIGDGVIRFEQKILPLTPQGFFVFGVGRDSPSSVWLSLDSNSTTKKIPITIQTRQWRVEKVNGLAKNKVNPKTKAELKRIAQESKLVKNVRIKSSQLVDFLKPFIMPARGRISGVYGSQRILNGEPKRPHFGLDIANRKGSVVVAPVDGVVLLVHQDMFYSGGTLIIDHGYGINTSYIHLNSIHVKVGQVVKQGQPVATIGATGRATGPHLDWRLNWFNTRLDPQLLVNKNLLVNKT